MLREAEVRLSQGQSIGLICKGLGISEQSYYRWRRDYGGLKLGQAKRLKDLERENARANSQRIGKRIMKAPQRASGRKRHGTPRYGTSACAHPPASADP